MSDFADRYQLLDGRVFSVRRWRDGRVARGQMTVAKFAAAFGLADPAEGWYDGVGRFLGDEANWPG